MRSAKNPARSRPLSANVRRLMRMARESPLNPAVEKIERTFSARDLAYCDMQGNIFMAAVDMGLDMAQFAPVYMNSQLAGVIDHSFSVAGGMEEDGLSSFLRIPVLMKSPQLIVEVVMWLDGVVQNASAEESAQLAVVQACLSEQERAQRTEEEQPERDEMSLEIPDEETLAGAYAYAYWLGYIYRCECHMHDESSRMVYGAFSEAFMREFYEKLNLDDDVALSDCAPEICRRLDGLLVGRLWMA